MENGIESSNQEIYEVVIDIQRGLRNLETLGKQIETIKSAVNDISNTPANIVIDIDSKEGVKAIENLDKNFKSIISEFNKKVSSAFNNLAEIAQSSFNKATPALHNSMDNLGKYLDSAISKGMDRAIDKTKVKFENAFNSKSHSIQSTFNKLFNIDSFNISEAINDFRKNFKELTTDPEFKGELNDLGSPFEKATEKISGLVGNLKNVNQELTTLGENLNNIKNNLSRNFTYRQQMLVMGLLGNAGAGTGGGGSISFSDADVKTKRAITSSYTATQTAYHDAANALKREAESGIKTNDKVREHYENLIADRNARKEERLTAQALKEARMRERRQTYIRNVQAGQELFDERPTGDVSSRRYYDEYARAVTRIRGIYQRAVQENKVVSPQAIYSALAQIDTRAQTYNRASLSEMFGLDEYKEKTDGIVRSLGRWGTIFQRISSLSSSVLSVFNTIRGISLTISKTLSNVAYQIFPTIFYGARSFASAAYDAYATLETAMIGFENFFGAENVDALVKRIKAEAVLAPGIDAADLAGDVREIAPLSNGDYNLALQATLGMLKTIQYGGGSNSEMAYVIKNIRDVMSKGRATQIDLNQFNRAMPALVKALESIGRRDLISSSGTLKITKENAGDLLEVFAQLNSSETSVVKDIFAQANNTLSGQIQQVQEQFITDWNTLLEDSGIYNAIKTLLKTLNDGSYIAHFLATLTSSFNGLLVWVENNQMKIFDFIDKLVESLEIVGDGVKTAWGYIRDAFGDVDTASIIKQLAEYLRDFISGLGKGTAQFIKLFDTVMDKLESLGLDKIITTLGWFGSVMGTVASRVMSVGTDILGILSRITLSAQQAVAIYRSEYLAGLQQQFNAVPAQAFSAFPNAALGYGGSGKSSRFMLDGINGLTTAIQSQTNILGTKLDSINQSVRAGTVGQAAETAKDLRQTASFTQIFGKNKPLATVGYTGPFSAAFPNRYVYAGDYDGTGRTELLKYNVKTGQYDPLPILDKNGNELKGAARTSKAQKMMVEQATKINKVNTAFDKMSNVANRVASGVGKFLAVQTVSATVSTAIKAMETFGEASTGVANAIDFAGTSLSFTLAGASVGGVAGGVIGALAGLGVAAVNLFKTLEEERNKLYNEKVNNALTQSQQKALDSVWETLQSSGLSTNREDTQVMAAYQGLISYIRSTPAADYSTEDAIEAYANALKFYKEAEKLNDFINSESSALNTNITGTPLDFSSDNADVKWLIDFVNEYRQGDHLGYSHIPDASDYGFSGPRYANVDSDGNVLSIIPGEQLLEEIFPNGMTNNQVTILRQYLEELNRTYDSSITSVAQEFLNGLNESDVLNSIDRSVKGIWGAVLSEKKGVLNSEQTAAVYGSIAGKAQKDYEDTMANNDYAHFEAFNLSRGATHYAPSEIVQDLQSELSRLKSNNTDGRLDREISYIEYLLTDYLQDWDWSENTDSLGILRWILYWRRAMEYYKKYPSAPSNPLRFAGGSILPVQSARGVDTIPAMLSKGEFVVRPSAVDKIGLPILQSLNHGDLTPFLREISGNLSNSYLFKTSNTVQSSSIRQNNNTINNFNISNYGTSSRMNTYYSLANRLN